MFFAGTATYYGIRWADRASSHSASILVNVVILVFAAIAGLTWVSDWFRVRKIRNRPSAFDTDELLRELGRLTHNSRRAVALRWVREQGRLMPSERGARMLSNLLAAIERDAANATRGRTFKKKVLCQPDSAWSAEFCEWYRDYTHGKPRLSTWTGLTLDELVRLREQARLRQQDASAESDSPNAKRSVERRNQPSL
jgi:hypothetical protein